MGKPKLTFRQECEAVLMMINGARRKTVARYFKTSESNVARIKREWPLFFWQNFRIRKSYIDPKYRWWEKGTGKKK